MVFYNLKSKLLLFFIMNNNFEVAKQLNSVLCVINDHQSIDDVSKKSVVFKLFSVWWIKLQPLYLFVLCNEEDEKWAMIGGRWGQSLLEY